MTNHLFHERHVSGNAEDNLIVHSAMSQMLALNTQAQCWLAYNVEDVFPGAAKTLDAFERFPPPKKSLHRISQEECMQGGESEVRQTGFSLASSEGVKVDDSGTAHICDGALPTNLRSFWDVLKEDPERSRIFNGAMAFVSNAGYETQDIVDTYDWSSLVHESGAGLLVDVGGGTGCIARAILRKAPGLAAVVQDLSEVIDKTQKSAQHPAYSGERSYFKTPQRLDTFDPVHGRLKYMAHDFFTPQPIHDADAYLLRHVLHDWPDLECLKILTNLVPYIRPGARIIVSEFILPRTNEGFSTEDEKRTWSIDLHMMVLYRSRERDLAEWKELFESLGPSIGKMRLEFVAKHLLCFVREA